MPDNEFPPPPGSGSPFPFPLDVTDGAGNIIHCFQDANSNPQQSFYIAGDATPVLQFGYSSNGFAQISSNALGIQFLQAGQVTFSIQAAGLYDTQNNLIIHPDGAGNLGISAPGSIRFDCGGGGQSVSFFAGGYDVFGFGGTIINLNLVTAVNVALADNVGLLILDVNHAYYDADQNQILAHQQNAISNATGTLADAVTKLNAILAALRAHGLIAT